MAGKSIKAYLEIDISKFTNGINSAKKDINSFKSELNQITSSLNKVNTAANAVNKSVNQTGNAVKQSNNSINSANTATNKLTQTKNRLQQSYNNVSQSARRYNTEIVNLAARTGQSVTAVNNAVNAKNRLNQSYNNVSQSARRFKAETVALASSMNTSVTAVNSARAAKDRLHQSYNNVSQSARRAKVETQTLGTSVATAGTQATTASSQFSKMSTVLTALGNVVTIVASLFVYQFVHALMQTTQETIKAKSEMESLFNVLSKMPHANFGESEINSFNNALSSTIKQFPKMNKYNLGETVAGLGVEFKLTANEMAKAMPIVSMVSSEYLRAGRTVEEATLAVKDILQGEFRRLSMETGVGKEELQEAGWDGDLKNVMGLLEAINKVGKERGWDLFASKAESLNDILLITQARFGEFVADLTSRITPGIVGAFNLIIDAIAWITKAWNGLPDFAKLGIVLLAVGTAATIAGAGLSKLLLPSILRLGTSAISAIKGLTAFILSLAGVGTGAATSSISLTLLRGTITSLRVAVLGLGKALLAFMVSPIGLAIIAIAAVVVAIYELGKAIGWWKDLTTMGEAVWSGLVRLWNAFANNPLITRAVEKLNKAWEGLVGWLSKVSKMWNDALPSKENIDIVNWLIDSIGWLGDAVYGFFTKNPVGQFLTYISPIGYIIFHFDELIERIQIAGDSLTWLITETPVGEMLTWLNPILYVSTHFKEVSKTVKETSEVLYDFFRNNPLGQLIACVSPIIWIITHLEYLQGVVDGLSKGWNDLWNDPTLKSSIEELKSAFSELGEVWGTLWDAASELISVFGQLWAALRGETSSSGGGSSSGGSNATTLDDYAQGVSAGVEFMKTVLEGLLWVVQGLTWFVQDVVIPVLNSVIWIIQQITSFLQWLTDGINWVRQAWTDFTTAIQTFLNDPLGVILGAINGLISAITGKSAEGKTAGEILGQAIGNGIMQILFNMPLIGPILQFIAGVSGQSGNASSAGNSVGTNTYNGIMGPIRRIGSEVLAEFSSMISSVATKAGEAYNAAKSVGESIWNGINSILQRASPGRIYHEVKDEFTVMADAIVGTEGLVYNAARGVGEAITTGFTPDVGATVSNMLNMIQQQMQMQSMLGNQTVNPSVTELDPNLNQTAMTQYQNDALLADQINLMTTANTQATFSGLLNTVNGTYLSMGNQQKTTMTGMQSTQLSTMNNIRATTESSLKNMNNTTKNATLQMTDSWMYMKDNIIQAASDLRTQANAHFNNLSSNIGTFYRRLQNPSQWGSAGGDGLTSSNSNPSRFKSAMSKVSGIMSSFSGGFAGGSSKDTRRNNHNKSGTLPLWKIVEQFCPDGSCNDYFFTGSNKNKRVNIKEFWDLQEHGYAGWGDWSPRHMRHIKDKSGEWDMKGPVINLAGGIPTGLAFKVKEFYNSTPNVGFDGFRQIAEAVFSTIDYDLYFNSDKTGHWLSAMQTGAVNCWDGAHALIALANVFGLSGHTQNGHWGGTAHTWAVINGMKMDTTAWQKGYGWDAPQSAGPAPSSWKYSRGNGSHNGNGGNNVSVTVNITGDVYGVDDLQDEIDKGVKKGIDNALGVNNYIGV
ncbi:hypothetical protein [Methanobrevibacter sp. DSM 116169]|uniref:hypothetical protein n=1 Tax=Methanobrevibacter sp. DSM 116169 TaxID=3242727 RepID=UPI0038FC3357